MADNLSTTKTAETLAAQHGVTERTIIRDGKKAEAIEQLAQTNPEAAQAVRDGCPRKAEKLLRRNGGADARKLLLSRVKKQGKTRAFFGG